MENPPTPILQLPYIQQSFNPNNIENEESTLTNNNEDKTETIQEETTTEETTQKEKITEEKETGNLDNP
ncbi:MAG: hypothetical protein QS2022_4300 [Candidatus Phytoplasma asteris]|nr:MAG: hypothetical protein PLY_4250 [Periwinkle leaf yellowing phytoplasma]WEX19678.1 MAG: hypothetical protein QS2022_4300 [Candidatus Phytoplasma asteris]